MLTKKEILQRITTTFLELFGRNIPEIKRCTTSSDVDGWDSFNNLNLIAAIEQSFEIRFSTRQIEGFKNVGDLVDMVFDMMRA